MHELYSESATGPFLRILALIVPIAIFLVGCEGKLREGSQSQDQWPTILATPIDGATFSLSESHLPGHSQERQDATHQGFLFFNGYSGRPLSNDEPIIAIADGEVVRIDHDYEDLEPEALAFWAEQAVQPGLAADYARDRLRGRQVWLRHADGHISRYAHLSMVHPELQPGDSIEQGQPIGLLGASGVVPSEETPAPEPRLHFDLWSPDGEHYFGQGLAPLEIHQQIAAAFGPAALPRYAQKIVEAANAGQNPPQPYPPEIFPDTGFTVDPPATVAAGNAFAISISWEDDEFEASSFYAILGNAPLGIIDAGEDTQLAWILGVMPLDSSGTDLTLIVGATDPYGQSLTGSSTIRSDRPEMATQAQEVDREQFDLFSEQNQRLEADRLGPVMLYSLEQLKPHWQQPFEPPLEGEVVGPFGQRIFYGMLRPAHPRPGIDIVPDSPEVAVQASNNGIVALAEELPIRGKTVAVAHGGGVVTVYAHLSEIGVSPGDQIAIGQRLGTVTQSESGETVPMRWEVHIAGTPSNPLGWPGKVLPGT